MISASAADMEPEEIAYGSSRWVRVRRIGTTYFLEGLQGGGRAGDRAWSVIGIAKDSKVKPGWSVGVGPHGFVGGPTGDRHDALVGLLEANAGVLAAWEKDRAGQARANEQGPGPLGSLGGAARPDGGVA